MGKPFLTGYCALVTGEKDPRNLRLAFSIAKILILEFDIADNVQVRAARKLTAYLAYVH